MTGVVLERELPFGCGALCLIKDALRRAGIVVKIVPEEEQHVAQWFAGSRSTTRTLSFASDHRRRHASPSPIIDVRVRRGRVERQNVLFPAARDAHVGGRPLYESIGLAHIVSATPHACGSHPNVRYLLLTVMCEVVVL